MNKLEQLDFSVFTWLNNLAQNKTIADLAKFFGEYGIYLLALVIFVYWFTNRQDLAKRIQARSAILLSIFSLVIARGIITEIIRALWHRPRPYESHNVIQVIAKDPEASFPSGHTTAMFAIAFVIYSYDKKLGCWLLWLVTISAISRVVAGVHYPADIIGGVLIAWVVAWLVYKNMRTKIEPLTQFFSKLSDRIIPFTKSR